MSLTSRSSTSGARVATVPLPLLYPGDVLLRDLAAGLETASRFFTVPPRNSATAVTAAARSRPTEVSLPAAVAQALAAHQRRCDGDECSIANAEALTAGRATCIITGQQAGLLGGPVYTVYKIATAVRLAQQAAERTGRRCVPVFWLASEDHDIGEANHTFGIKPDGEIGRVSFRAPGGRELRRLPVDAEVTRSVARYFDHLLPAGDRRRARCAYALDGQRTFTGWVARSWMRLFAGTGLVIVEPELLRPACGELFERALRARAAAAETLDGVAGELRAAGYRAPLDPATAGTPFEVGPDGTRVRVADAGAMLRQGGVDPAALSTDAALRPIFADALLPNLAHVVGTGEMAYHAMLRPLYALFGVAQPAVLPRRSLTFLAEGEAEALERYAVSVEEALTGAAHPGAATDRLLGDGDVAEFERVAAQIYTAFQPLADSVSAVDPTLARTWQRSRDHALRGLARLRSRTGRAVLARRGYSRAALHRLLNQVRPRGRPQERVFPAPHFLARFGAPFLDACLIDEPAGAFTHEVMTLPSAPDSP
jgi:bacillithiol biosynthesis cysteine-adding enzyme BshC